MFGGGGVLQRLESSRTEKLKKNRMYYNRVLLVTVVQAVHKGLHMYTYVQYKIKSFVNIYSAELQTMMMPFI